MTDELSSTKSSFAVDNDKYDKHKEVDEKHDRPDDHFWLFFYCQIHQHSIIEVANLNTALGY